jgi:hypothetical protein
LQYEYVYRAIADYVDLYMNKEEEYEYSVPVGTLNNGTTKVRLHYTFLLPCLTLGLLGWRMSGTFYAISYFKVVKLVFEKIY